MKFTHVLTYLVPLILLASCSKEDKLKMSSSFVEFTTDVKLTLYNVYEKDSSKVADVMSSSKAVFEYFNSEMNPYVKSSSINSLNSLEPGKRAEIPDALKEIMRISLNLYRYTDRYFNVAVLPVVELWGFYSGASPKKPDDNDIKELLKISDMDCYEFTQDSVLKKDARCRIGLGGIAKGYAVDSVAAHLISRGFNDFIIEAGGDLIVRASEPKKIGIKHPREDNGMIDTLYVSNGAVATSGDYEKYIVEDGVRYCHIINPYTGYGVSDMLSVTVISDKAYMSDAFATAAFAMGREKAEYIIRKNGLSAIIYYINDQNTISRITVNMEKYLRKN